MGGVWVRIKGSTCRIKEILVFKAQGPTVLKGPGRSLSHNITYIVLVVLKLGIGSV